MCFAILHRTKSLVTCRTPLVVALLCITVGYFVFPCDSSRSSQNNKMEQMIQSTTKKLGIMRQKLALSSLESNQTFDISYCHFETCKIIKCSCIPAHLDPGVVAKLFIENTFKIACGSNISIDLRLEKSKFPGNRLRKMWLKTDLVVINELTFANCFLTQLDDKAFSSKIFNNTTKLYLLNNDISILNRATFRYLTNLQDLSIESNEIKQAEKNLLKDVASKLQNLQLDDSIKNIQVLRNITGGDILPAVRILSLRYNHIPIIDSQLFSSVPNVVSLYLSDSHVKTVCTNAFELISNSVKQIVMNDNNITTLPEGLFDSIIHRNSDFGLIIDNNLWHCDCSLKWMQDLLRNHPNVIKKTLICTSPKLNADKAFQLANFCNEIIPDTTNADPTACKNITLKTTTSNTSPTTESDSIETIHVNCDILSNQLFDLNYSHQGFSTTDLEIPLRFQNFFAAELGNGSVLITLPDSNDISLIWFANNARSNLASLEKSIQCVSKVKGSFLLQNLQSETSYTICLLDNFSFSLLNCLGLTTYPSLKSEPWLTTTKKSMIIIIFISSLILVCFVSAIIMFVMVRQHPTMLRGSKRIVIAKRRTHADIIILPKGLSSDNIESVDKRPISMNSRNLKEKEYVTPLPTARNSVRKNSKSSASSSQSDGISYISGIEPTSSQLNSWRLKRTLHMNWEAESSSLPPPLPPYPYRNVAQPLSTVEDMNENELQDDFTCPL